jgi:hypothetical protein
VTHIIVANMSVRLCVSSLSSLPVPCLCPPLPFPALFVGGQERRVPPFACPPLPSPPLSRRRHTREGCDRAVHCEWNTRTAS